MPKKFPCFCRFLVDLGALVDRKIKNFKASDQVFLELQAAEVALFRVLPV